MELAKPTFVAALHLLSDVLAILGNLSRTIQIEGLNLITVEQLVTSSLAALSELEADPFQGGYMSTLPEVLTSLEISQPLDRERFIKEAQLYITELINNIKNRFPQVHLLTCLGYFDPRNVDKATPAAIIEVSELLMVDGHKLWQDFAAYKSLVKTIPNPTTRVLPVVEFLHSPSNKEAMSSAYPMISDIVAWIAVLPAASAGVERVFSAMKRIRSSVRNRLKTKNLDHLLRISMEGPEITDWDPVPALRKWESWGNRRIQTSQTQCQAQTSSESS